MKKTHDWKRYNWQHPDWPRFKFDLSSDTQELIYRYVLEAGLLAGGLEQLPNDIKDEAIIDVMVHEALTSSAIEGENISYQDIRSSIRKELGILSSHTAKDARAFGIAQLMVSLRQTYDQELTEQQFFAWHAMLFSAPEQRRGIEIGIWRHDTEPMQIVSGSMGQEIVHFEAPPSERIAREMTQFIEWFNTSRNAPIPGLIRAAIAHLYFESIHPFDDGNGRIGRALSEKVLCQDLKRPVLFSLSTTIQKNKKEYYAELSRASHYDLDISSWINYFVTTIYQAQLEAKNKIEFIFNKTKFWKKYESHLNERQEKVIARMFDAGESGFDGGMSAAKYMSIAKCSKATATRDLRELLDKGCFIKLPGAGRSTHYSLNL